jgi:cyclophilin family peptidyl-prolyl cis-trans isomerase
MMKKLILFILLITAIGIQGCNMNKMTSTKSSLELVKINTSYGDMLIYLYDSTPKHKANFLKLAKDKFFDGTTFHRVIKNFVIQGGDPNSKDNDPNNDGQGGPGYTIDAEIKHNIKHKYGAIGAARDNNPEKKSNGSQFYVVVNKTGTPFLDNNYTVFGEVIAGMDVAEKIASVPSDGANNRPLSEVKMTVTVEKMSLKDLEAKYGFKIESLQSR